MIGTQISADGLAAKIYRAIRDGAFQNGNPASSTAEFMIVRHLVRANHERIADARQTLALARRTAKRLEASPFNKHRLNQVNDHITALREYQQELFNSRRALAQIVIQLAKRIDLATTLEQRLELLNCNPADRAELKEANIGLVELISVYCVEDSAAHRGAEYNNQPLHSAIWPELIRSMRDRPEGRAAMDSLFDEAFAPGGIFYGVSTYSRQPDGSMKRKAPSLVLHDASGSRVIERTPS